MKQNVPEVWPPFTCIECGCDVTAYGECYDKQDVLVCKECLERYRKELGDPWHIQQNLKKERMKRRMTPEEIGKRVALVVTTVIGAATVAIALALVVLTWRWALGL